MHRQEPMGGESEVSSEKWEIPGQQRHALGTCGPDRFALVRQAAARQRAKRYVLGLCPRRRRASSGEPPAELAWSAISRHGLAKIEHRLKTGC
jgi:hypothetical protein